MFAKSLSLFPISQQLTVGPIFKEILQTKRRVYFTYL